MFCKHAWVKIKVKKKRRMDNFRRQTLVKWWQPRNFECLQNSVMVSRAEAVHMSDVAGSLWLGHMLQKLCRKGQSANGVRIYNWDGSAGVEPINLERKNEVEIHVFVFCHYDKLSHTYWLKTTQIIILQLLERYSKGSCSSNVKVSVTFWWLLGKICSLPFYVTDSVRITGPSACFHFHMEWGLTVFFTTLSLWLWYLCLSFFPRKGCCRYIELTK